MKIEGIHYLLLESGYQFINSNVPFIKFYVKRYNYSENENRIDVIGCVDNLIKNYLSVEQLDSIAFQIERKYLFAGIEKVNMIYFIYSDNVERDKIYCECKTKFWLIDILAKQLIVFENQPEDFNNLRGMIEEVLKIKEGRKIRYGDKLSGENVSYIEKLKDVRHLMVGNNKFPIVTLLLIIINAAVFLILECMGSTNDVVFMLNHGAAYYQKIYYEHEYYRLFTCMFMHFGFGHLFNNMISLWLLGSEVERFFGKIDFIIIYITSGFIGSLLSSVYSSILDSNTVSAGASGAVYGLIGSLIVKMVEDKKRNRSSFGKILIVLIILMMVGRPEEGIDNIAHIGGFAAGMLTGILCYKTRLKIIEK